MKNTSEFIADFRSKLNEFYCSYDHEWVVRKRKINSEVLFSAVSQLVLERSSVNYKLTSDFLRISNCLIGQQPFPRFSASSLCAARKKLSPYLFVDVSQWIYSYIATEAEHNRWFGMSVFAVDSTNITLPRELWADGFDGMSEPDSYYPRGMLTTIFDLRLGLTYDSILSQYYDERRNAMVLLKGLPEGSLLIGDRGYFCFNLFYSAERENVQLMLRADRCHAPLELEEFIDSDSVDQLITMTPGLDSEKKALAAGFNPHPVCVRAVSYTLKNTKFVIVTTILDRTITRGDIQKLYKSRWDIEEEYKLLKPKLKLEEFHSKNINGVLQEIYATIFVANLSHALIFLESGAKSKRKLRHCFSPLNAAFSLKKVFFSLLFEAMSSLAEVMQFLRQTLKRGEVKFRPGRRYQRRSFKNVSPWSVDTDGVRC